MSPWDNLLSSPDHSAPAAREQRSGGHILPGAIGAAIVLMLASPLVAQVPPPAPAPAPTVITRSLTLEWIIVTVMIGAVLFAVCRSSRRN